MDEQQQSHQRPGSKEAAHSPPILPAEAGQEGPLADHQPPGYELAASPLTNGSVETGLTPPPTATATWRSRGRRSRADVAAPHTITTGRTRGATIATHTGTPEIGTTTTTDIGTIYTSAATTVQAVRRVVGIAWPQDVAQEARRMNVRAADTRNPYNNKDQVPSPGSSKVIPNCPRSNQDQVLSPGSDKDIRNSLGSNQDQVINPWITRDLSTALAIARVLQHAFWKQGSITHPCRNKDSNNQALR
ncbi:hypothetical protein ACLKA7_005670 [Drosophila subpalustris]